MLRMDARKSLSGLEDIALLTSTSVLHALQAALVTHMADVWFMTGPRDVYTRNPANSLEYIALTALEEREVIYIAEVLLDEHKVHQTDAPIRRKQELFLHRDALSHPVTVKWRAPDRQQFFDDHGRWTHLRPAIVWDFQKSVNEELRKRGRRPLGNEGISVTEEMATMLSMMLRSSIRPDCGVPPLTDLLRHMRDAAPKYIEALEQHPDGVV